MRKVAWTVCVAVGCTGCAGPSVREPGGPGPRLAIGQGPAMALARIEAAQARGVGHAFLIGRFEVTQAQYAAFIRATGYDGSDHLSSKGSEPFLADWRDGRGPAGREDHPVCYVNLHHARAYCAWASRVTGRTVRLPTDAEWELAARGPEGRRYPWGDEWDPARCNWGDSMGGDRYGVVDGFEASSPVGWFGGPGGGGRSGATPQGVCDMAGNIWEWTAEGHLRGGPWCMGPETVRSDAIAREDTERCDDKFGLRVVVEATPEPEPAR